MAFSDKQQLADRVEAMLRNTVAHGVPRSTIANLADNAVAWLSQYSPRIVTGTLSGDGSSFQILLSGLTVAWVNGFSRIRFVEHPEDEQDRQILDPNSYELFPDPDVPTHLHFVTAPASGTDNIRVSYTVLHTVSASSSTVPDHEEPAHEYGLAALVCKTKAAEFAHSTDPLIDADAVDYRAKSAEWLALEDNFLSLAGSVLGLDLSQPATAASIKPASARLDWDPVTRFGHPLHRLTHGERGR